MLVEPAIASPARIPPAGFRSPAVRPEPAAATAVPFALPADPVDVPVKPDGTKAGREAAAPPIPDAAGGPSPKPAPKAAHAENPAAEPVVRATPDMTAAVIAAALPQASALGPKTPTDLEDEPTAAPGGDTPGPAGQWQPMPVAILSTGDPPAPADGARAAIASAPGASGGHAATPQVAQPDTAVSGTTGATPAPESAFVSGRTAPSEGAPPPAGAGSEHAPGPAGIVSIQAVAVPTVADPTQGPAAPGSPPAAAPAATVAAAAIARPAQPATQAPKGAPAPAAPGGSASDTASSESAEDAPDAVPADPALPVGPKNLALATGTTPSPLSAAPAPSPPGTPEPEAGRAAPETAAPVEDGAPKPRAVAKPAGEAEIAADSSASRPAAAGEPVAAAGPVALPHPPGIEPAAVTAVDPRQAPAGGPSTPIPLGGVPTEIGLRSLGGSSRFEIRLSPDDLGRIDVRIEIDGDKGVRAHLAVERPETLAFLARDRAQLERVFEQAGLKPAEGGIAFSLRDGDAGGRGGSGDPGRDLPRPAAAPAPGEDGPIRLPVVPASPYRSSGRPAGIDLRI